MNRLESFKRRFAYNRWAEDRILGALRQSGRHHAGTVAILAHGISSGEMWLWRLKGEDRIGEPQWPEWSLGECETKARELGSAWEAYLNGLSDVDLDSPRAHEQSEGIPFEAKIGDVLEHVLAHAAYHRGQIASTMRLEGGVPSNTDFINFLREGSS